MASWARVKASMSPSAARWPAIMMPMPASPAPAAIASGAKNQRHQLIPVACFMPWRRGSRRPRRRGQARERRRPGPGRHCRRPRSAPTGDRRSGPRSTKALISASLSSTTSTLFGSSPAASISGFDICLNSSSVSLSRSTRSDRLPPPPAGRRQRQARAPASAGARSGRPGRSSGVRLASPRLNTA